MLVNHTLLKQTN